ncbi:hypothetical protein P8452_72493 [Trifolium repens]|nr:hypothetical protein P8452_72493 [Trifolium repens]
MFHYQRLRAILNPQTPKCYFLKPFSTITTTSDSDQQSFTVSYLTNTCGLSPQKALKASKQFRFNTPNKPDSVITFFKTHGFSNDQIQSIVHRVPILLTFDPIKTILPNFQFLSSKGASPSDIVDTVTRNPHFLGSSLQKQIIPTFELVLEEIKELGFDPSSYKFCMALLAKRAITKSQWDAKVDALKSWGCSEDEIFNAFKKQPGFMLRSADKLNAVMRFWIKQLGWDPLLLLSAPALFGFSIEKRLIPRASVVQYLLSKGLMKTDASLITPFNLTDELFRQRYVNRFEEEAYKLLKLYQGEASKLK